MPFRLPLSPSQLTYWTVRVGSLLQYLPRGDMLVGLCVPCLQDTLPRVAGGVFTFSSVFGLLLQGTLLSFYPPVDDPGRVDGDVSLPGHIAFLGLLQSVVLMLRDLVSGRRSRLTWSSIPSS